MLGILKFSRGFEAEADYLGVEYMYRAGYDPSAFVSFFEKIQAMEKKKPGTLGKDFRYASADSGPDREDAGRNSQDSAGEAAVRCDDLGIRRSQGAAGVD